MVAGSELPPYEEFERLVLDGQVPELAGIVNSGKIREIYNEATFLIYGERLKRAGELLADICKRLRASMTDVGSFGTVVYTPIFPKKSPKQPYYQRGRTGKPRKW